ncbi:MAG: hypothetical protein ACRYHA_24795 [Janthinobacterium lividum]
MDDEALDELEARLISLREQALEQVALSQRIRRELEQAAGAPARTSAPRPAPPRRIPRDGPARAPLPDGESSWRTLGARLRHRMRLA